MQVQSVVGRTDRAQSSRTSIACPVGFLQTDQQVQLIGQQAQRTKPRIAEHVATFLETALLLNNFSFFRYSPGKRRSPGGRWNTLFGVIQNT